MKGSNKLELNEATMIAAVQHYFNEVVYRQNAAPQVTGVWGERDGGTKVFKVHVCEPEKASGAK